MSDKQVKGHPSVLAALNKALAGELTAINQYMLHAKLLESWGYDKRAKLERAQSIDEMRHAERIMDRIMLLEGQPEMAGGLQLKIGKNLKDVIECDLALELDGIADYRDGIAIAEEHRDFATRDFLIGILEDEEKHQDGNKTELELIERIGLENFGALQV